MKTPVLLASLTLAALFGVPGVRAQQQENLVGISVNDAVSIALRNNRDVLNVREETRRAGYRITEAASAAYPQINGSFTLDKNLKPQVFVISFPDSNGVLQQNRLKIGTDYNASLGANLTQPIWVGGKVGTALKAAKIYREISNYTEESVEQNVVLGTMTAFNSAILARELGEIARQSLEQAQNHLENVRALQEAGAATEYDLLRARVNVSNQRPQLLEAENNARTSLLRLKEIMGVDPEAPIKIDGSFAYPDTTVLQTAQARVALENRPDIQASRLTIDLQEKVVGIARGDFLPTLSAGTTFAYTGNMDDLKYRASDWSPYWFANVSLTFPIFTGFNNYAKYKQAKVDHLKAKTDYRKTQDAAIIEVQEDIMDFRMSLRQIESQQLNVEEAQRAVELAGNLYRNGRATQLEVLDAQLALEAARTNMTSALYEGTMAEVNLRKSLGLLETER